MNIISSVYGPLIFLFCKMPAYAFCILFFWGGAREKKREGACFPLEVKTALELAGARPQAAACASQAEASYRLLYTFVFPFCIDL